MTRIRAGGLLGYARFSTLEQNSRPADRRPKAAGCCRVFTDRASGALDERRELAKPCPPDTAGASEIVFDLAWALRYR
ncbi:MAG: recombinase family protein [Acidimicrobiales bacterium]